MANSIDKTTKGYSKKELIRIIEDIDASKIQRSNQIEKSKTHKNKESCQIQKGEMKF